MSATNAAIYQPSETRVQEMRNLKSLFPFRIIYGAFNPKTQEWFASAVTTMRIPNKLMREGWQVFTLEVGK